MTTSSITTKFATVLLAGAVESAWALSRVGDHLYAKLDTLGWVWAHHIGWGGHIEILAERTAARLSIDMVAGSLNLR